MSETKAPTAEMLRAWARDGESRVGLQMGGVLVHPDRLRAVADRLEEMEKALRLVVQEAMQDGDCRVCCCVALDKEEHDMWCYVGIARAALDKGER